MHHAEIRDQARIMNDESVSFHRSVGDPQEKITHLQREVDSQRLANSRQDNIALTLFRAKLVEAEQAAALAGAAAGRNEM